MNKLLILLGFSDKVEPTWENLAFALKVKIYQVRLLMSIAILYTLWDVFHLYSRGINLDSLIGLLFDLIAIVIAVMISRSSLIEPEIVDEEGDEEEDDD